MKILVIDNGASNIQNLLNALYRYQTTLVTLSDFNLESAGNYDVVVISGSVHNAVVKKPEVYSKEIELIKQGETAIVGICMGFEVIAYTFGAKFLHLKERISGLKKIKVISNDTFFQGKREFSAAENHKWTVQEVNHPLEVLAVSDNGIEIIRHKSLPIYGVQFHPESPLEGNESKFILDSLLEEISTNKGII